MYKRGLWDFTPEEITSLPQNHIFVFGSNEAGIHGKGAAKTALQWGAKFRKGVGMYGRTYAIPTKDENIQTLPKDFISEYVGDFKCFAADQYDLVFVVTKIGTGLAGYDVDTIGPMFKGSPPNVILPFEFEKYR